MKKLFYLFLLFPIITSSQTISNVTSKQNEKKIEISYNLSGLSPNKTCRINLYYSLNSANYIGPLQKVSGNVGNYVSGDGNKQITWDVLAEIGSIEGNTQFKVEIIPETKELYKKYTSDGFNYKVTSCNFKANQLIVDVNITNLSEDTRLFLRCNEDIKLTDENGNQYICNNFIVSQINVKFKDYRQIDFVKDVPVKISFVFIGVESNIKLVKLLDAKFRDYYYNSSNIKSRLQIKDIVVLKR